MPRFALESHALVTLANDLRRKRGALGVPEIEALVNHPPNATRQKKSLSGKYHGCIQLSINIFGNLRASGWGKNFSPPHANCQHTHRRRFFPPEFFLISRAVSNTLSADDECLSNCLYAQPEKTADRGGKKRIKIERSYILRVNRSANSWRIARCARVYDLSSK